MEAEESEDDRIRKEQILGVIPAVLIPNKKGWIRAGADCGLVFATRIMILAFPRKQTQSVRRERYHITKREWSRYEHKPADEILSDEDAYASCEVIPYSKITHLSFADFGRLRKWSILRIHTDESGVHRVLMFYAVTDLKTLEKDVDQLLLKAGVRFSHGEAGDF